MTKSTASLLLVALLSVSTTAWSHKPSDSYLGLAVDGRTVDGQWDLSLRDLEFAIGLDANDDGEITWGELRRRHRDIAHYALSRLTIRAGAAQCSTRPIAHLVDWHSDGAYHVLRFEAECQRTIATLELDYGLFFDLDPSHRGLVRTRFANTVTTAILSADRPHQQFDLAVADPGRQFLDYVREGVWHVWSGLDHVLFLVTLLLPAVLRRRRDQWLAVAGAREAAVGVVAIVSAFTLAHATSLSLAVLEVIAVPTRWIESTIAATVVIVALNNLYPIVTRHVWLAAFGFGLVHGLGFANVLMGLGLPEGSRIGLLLGFNFGVEIGQLVIVAALLPVCYRLRDRRFYRRVVVGAGSLAIAATASVWLVERAFDPA